MEWGEPQQIYDDGFLYVKNDYFICKDEIMFIIQHETVIDILFTEYILGIAVQNILYFPENKEENYKVQSLIFKNKIS